MSVWLEKEKPKSHHCKIKSNLDGFPPLSSTLYLLILGIHDVILIEFKLYFMCIINILKL
jgi:hypothetical protein